LAEAQRCFCFREAKGKNPACRQAGASQGREIFPSGKIFVMTNPFAKRQGSIYFCPTSSVYKIAMYKVEP